VPWLRQSVPVWQSRRDQRGNVQTNHTYTYDEAGRLTQATNNVGGENCITHVYAYDEETNRLSLTTRAPGTGGICASEGGEVQNHTYDPANRLTDTTTKYDSFGNTTELPAADAGGTVLTSTYYQNNKVASQTQGTQTLGYQLDPASRTREIVSTGKVTATEIQHYTSPSANTPAWTGELSTNYTRYITGISGTLIAIQHNSEKPVLQLANLHGDNIATATDSETVTEPASTIAEASEYGIPATETPAKYSWLGAHEIPTTLPSGVTTMGARTYIPQLGRFLQTDPRPGGSANTYAYTYGDPVNTNDLTGEWTFQTPAWLQTANKGWGAREEQAQLAREQAAREEAERLAAKAAAEAQAYAAMLAEASAGEGLNEEGPEEEWEEESEEGAEYTAYRHSSAGGKPGTQEAHVEEGLLYQQLGKSASEGQAAQERTNLAALCQSELKSHAEPSQHGACARYVDVFGIGKAVSKAAKWVWKAAKKVYKSTLRKVNTVVKAIRYAYNCGKAIGSHERGYGGCDPLTFVGINPEPAY